ncbi:hypothetical protein FNV43_RR02434 [Rhamnella rubrinervis]|uniref:Uncharacterized protein n=1 Tax=Rhamnella rubrinervis TaxID=2594499 RepID=A0A8K0MU05_9ROSA|nr:hypothetical protein FNV43_RR02434 [Rhamnella rubrinervis]
MAMMILGKKKDDRYDLKGLVEEVLHLIGAFNLADYVPLLGKLDLRHGKNGGRKDLEKLDYLYMVVKESLGLHRLHHFLQRGRTTIEGYHIPRKSRIIVSVWAIGHDQSVWSKMWKSFAERFIEKNIDIRGNDFDLIPFGVQWENMSLECNWD